MNLFIFIVGLVLPLIFLVNSWGSYYKPPEPEVYLKVKSATADSRELVSAKVSPSGKYIGELYSWQLLSGGEDYDFFIYDVQTTATKKIFSIGTHFSSWEWLDDERIKIRMGCGTNCVAFKVMSKVSSLDYTDYRKNMGEDWWTESLGYEPPSI